MPTMNVSAASAPLKAQAEMGQAIAGIGDAALNYAMLDRQATRTIVAAEVELGMSKDINDLSWSFENRNDFENFEDEMKNGLDSIYAKYLPKVEKDHVLQAAFDKAFANQSMAITNTVRSQSAKSKTDRGRASLDEITDASLEEYSNIIDPAKRQKAKSDYEAKVDSFYQAGIINAQTAGNYNKNFILSAEKLRAERLIDLNPEEAIKAISSGDFELPTDMKEALKGTAEKQIEINKNKAEIIKNQILQEEENAKKEAKEAEKQVVYGEILKGNYAGAYEKAMSSQNLDNDEKVSLQTSIKTLSEKSKNGKDPTEESDPQTYAGLSKIVYTNPDSITPNEIYSYVGKGEIGGISTKQAEILVNELQTHKAKKEPDPWEAAAKAVNDNFARDRKEGLFGEGSEGDLEYARQLQDFSTWRKNNPDKDPTDYYARIIESQSAGVINNWLGTVPTPKEAREAIKAEQDKVVIRQKIEQPIEIEGISEADQNIIKKALEDAGQPVTEANILHVYKMNTK